MKKYKKHVKAEENLKEASLPDPKKFVGHWFNGDYERAFLHLINHQPISTAKWAKDIQRNGI